MNKQEIEKAIEYFQNATISFSSPESGVKAMKVRDLAISALTQQLNNGWISVSERMPEVFDNVFVTSKTGGRTIAHRVPNQNNWYDLHSTVVETGVIAWQPLPEPYKEMGLDK